MSIIMYIICFVYYVFVYASTYYCIYGMLSFMINTRFNNITVYLVIIIHTSAFEQVTGY